MPTNRELEGRWTTYKANPVRVKVIKVLKSWLTNEMPWEDLKDSEFVATFRRLSDSMVKVEERSKPLQLMLEISLLGDTSVTDRKFPFPAFSSSQSRTEEKEVAATDWTVAKLAKDLTTYQERLRRQISCANFLRFLKEPASAGAALHHFLLHCDELGAWITNQITQSDISSGKQLFFIARWLTIS